MALVPGQSFAADVQVAEELAVEDWNVFMHPREDTLLATRNGNTLTIRVGRGRESEQLITDFVDSETPRDELDRIARACLPDYTAEERDEAIDTIHRHTR